MEEKLRRKKIIKIVIAIAVVVLLGILGVKYVPDMLNSNDHKSNIEVKSAEASEKAADEITVKMSIDCKDLAKDMSQLEEKSAEKYIPKDGMILKEIEVNVKKDATVFDVFKKVCEENNIQFEHKESSAYGSYVTGINFIYEQCAGKSSGWSFVVNDKMTDSGASTCKLKDGDNIRWYFICDYGKM